MHAILKAILLVGDTYIQTLYIQHFYHIKRQWESQRERQEDEMGGLMDKSCLIDSILLCPKCFFFLIKKVDYELVFAGFFLNVSDTVKAANRKFISFMSFENITFIYRALQVWAWPWLDKRSMSKKYVLGLTDNVTRMAPVTTLELYRFYL